MLGGYGYTREYPVERLYRDNRLNHIHEGTFGIQGMDLLGRKVRMQGGAGLALLLDEIAATIARAPQDLQAEARALQDALATLSDTTATVLACEDRDLGLANATEYLDAFGHIVIGWIWLWQATTAVEKLASATSGDVDFYSGKLAACRYFFRYVLPEANRKLALVASLDDTCLMLRPEAFIGT